MNPYDDAMDASPSTYPTLGLSGSFPRSSLPYFEPGIQAQAGLAENSEIEEEEDASDEDDFELDQDDAASNPDEPDSEPDDVDATDFDDQDESTEGDESDESDESDLDEPTEGVPIRGSVPPLDELDHAVEDSVYNILPSVEGKHQKATSIGHLALAVPAKKRGRPPRGAQKPLPKDPNSVSSLRNTRRGRRPRGEGQRGAPPGKRGPQAPPPTTHEFNELQSQASQAYLDRDLDKAATFARKAITNNPEVFAPYQLLADILYNQGKPNASICVLWSGAHTRREAVNWWEVAHRTLSYPEKQTSDLRRAALYCYSQILKRDRNNIAAHKKRLEQYHALDSWHRADNAYKALIKLCPYNLELLRDYAHHSTKMNRPHNAKQAYDIALNHFYSEESDGENSVFEFRDLCNYVDLFIQMGKSQEGISVLRRTSRWLLGRKTEGFWDDSIDDREWDEKDTPRRIQVAGFKPGVNSPDAYGEGLPLELRARLSILRLKLGGSHFHEAERHFTFFNPEDTDDDSVSRFFPDLFRYIAESLHENEHYEDALCFYHNLMTVNAFDFSKSKNVGHCYFELRDFDQATKHYEVALARYHRDIDARLNTAIAYQRLESIGMVHRHVAELVRQGRVDLIQQSSEIAHTLADPNIRALVESYERERKEEQRRNLEALSDDAANLSSVLAAPRRRQKMNDAIERAPKIYGSVDIIHLYDKLERLAPAKDTGDSDAISEWMNMANRLIRVFKEEGVRFPPHDETHPFGFQATHTRKEKKQRATAKMSHQESCDGESAGEDKVDFSEELESASAKFGGVLFADWLDIFCEQALLQAQCGERIMSKSLIKEMVEATNVNRNDPCLKYVHAVSLACALIIEDDQWLCDVCRWYMREHPYCTDTYRLYALMNRLCKGKAIQYHASQQQKFVMRQVRAMDFALMSDTQRKKWPFHEWEVPSFFSQNPFNLSEARGPSETYEKTLSKSQLSPLNDEVTQPPTESKKRKSTDEAANKVLKRQNNQSDATPCDRSFLNGKSFQSTTPSGPPKRKRKGDEASDEADTASESPNKRPRAGAEVNGDAASVPSALLRPGNPYNIGQPDPALLMLFGHMFASVNNQVSALNFYFRAYASIPEHPIVLFSIAVAYVHAAMRRRIQHRHYHVMQALAWFGKYRKARLQDTSDESARNGWHSDSSVVKSLANGSGTNTSNIDEGSDEVGFSGEQETRSAFKLKFLRKMEVLYNEGRLFNALGLGHLAVKKYEECLAVHIPPVTKEIKAAANGAGKTQREEEMRLAEPDFKHEAAYALQNIFVLAGDMRSARQVAEKWMVI